MSAEQFILEDFICSTTRLVDFRRRLTPESLIEELSEKLFLSVTADYHRDNGLRPHFVLVTADALITAQPQTPDYDRDAIRRLARDRDGVAVFSIFEAWLSVDPKYMGLADVDPSRKVSAVILREWRNKQPPVIGWIADVQEVEGIRRLAAKWDSLEGLENIGLVSGSLLDHT